MGGGGVGRGQILNTMQNRRHTDPNGRYDQNEIKRNKALIILNKIALYFGLQYKPSSGAIFFHSAPEKPKLCCYTLIGLLLWLYSF